ncbi:hypothetical protein H9L13_07535 [Sphingomonas lutea]|uniref:DUF2968 domain-containing protein n=1 Tax=Sphingomonas lutea TaxID=1045317 RepID=A0A7G9SFD9_9SPHN|nr:hypothetical protein [Sphingomonas lutea]QNN66564.1 hypothetical protein H9L13_07535 [Sphingomonas lutea]
MRWIVLLLLATTPVAALHANPEHDGGDSDRMSYVLFTDGSNSSMASGDLDDFYAARKHRASGGPMLYVRQDGQSFVIRDPAILARAQAIMAPQMELGRRQGALGDQQGELGRRQGALGGQQGQLGARMADSTPRQMAELGREMSALGARQSELGKQQAALGARQAELGREQSRLAELAKPQFRALVEEAIRRGVAQRVN